MSAHIVIHDGATQWWLSPDVWVVPGSDPAGAPGAPIAGKPAYLWARVSNTGSSAAPGTRVDYYWANPSDQMVAGIATAIGSAYVDLAPGETQEVLCLAPWVPVIVNGGHECILAVAHGPDDLNPLPDPLPNGYAFDPPSHDQVAQRNLAIIDASSGGAPFALTITGLRRTDKRVRITAEVGGTLEPRILEQLALPKARPVEKSGTMVGLSREARGTGEGGAERQSLDLQVPRGTLAPVYVSIRSKALARNEYELVHVVARSGDKIVGGVSYVIVHALRGASS